MPDLATIVLLNGVWLLAPVMLWNVALAARLPRAFSPEVFWREIPAVIAVPENTLRLALFALPCVTALGIDSTYAPGYIVYGLGVAVYCASWLALIARPTSRWSRHAVGFLAPAYTPALWLVGLALSTRSLVSHDQALRSVFLALAAAFLGFHVTHVALIFRRERSGDPRA